MSYQVPQHIDKNKIFIVNRSEIEGRLDAHYNKPMYSKIWQKLFSLSTPLTTLKDNSENIFSGITPKSGGDAYVLSNGVPFVRSGDFSDANVIDFSSLLLLREDIHNGIMKNSQLKKGDLLIAIVGATIGKIGVYKYDLEANINQAVCAVRLKKTLDPYYVQAFFQTSIGQKIIERIKRPVARANINLEEVGNLPIPLLDIISQRKVVEYVNEANRKKHEKEKEAQQLLDSIDGYLLKELGIKLPEYHSDLNNRIFYVQHKELTNRIDPYYSQQYFKNSFEAICSGKYPIDSLGKLSVLITSGITPKSGGSAYTEDKVNGIPFIRSGNINVSGDLDYNELLYLKPEIHNTIMRSSQVHTNDIMIAIVGATIGQVGIYLSDREANINQAIALVRLKQEIDVQYVKELIKSKIGQISLNRLKRPVARANINLEEIATIQVVVPPLNKQHEIAKHIKEIRKQAKMLQEQGKAILENEKREVERMIMENNIKNHSI